MNNQELFSEFFKQLEEEEFSKERPPSCPDRSDPEPPSETTDDQAPADPGLTDYLSALLSWAENRCPDQAWSGLLARKDDPGAPLWLKADALGLDELSHRVLCLALANAIRVEEDLQNAPVPNHAELSLMKTLYALHIGSPGKRATALVRLTDCLRSDSPLVRLGYLSVDPRLASAGRSDADPMGIGPFLRLKFGLNALALGRLMGKGPEQADQNPNLYATMVLPQTVRETLDRLMAHPEILTNKFRLLIQGPEHHGGRTLAQAIAQHLQQPLKTIKPWDGPQPGFVALLHVESSFDSDDWTTLADHPGLLVFRAGPKDCRFDIEHACNLSVDLSELNKGELILFANRRLKEAGALFDKVNPIDVAGGSGLTPGALVDAMAKIKEEAEWQGHDPDAVPHLLMKAIKRVQKDRKEFTQEVQPKLTVADLCLDRDHMSRFLRIIQGIRGRQALLTRWNLDPSLVGKAKVVLFHGPSGTGKSMGAEVLAHELGLPLKRIEASSLESAYVGESEQKLHKFFQEARKGNPSVLLFDEADAVLGNRSAAEGSTRRYQVSLTNAWLRELDEGFDGVLVFTTNHAQNFDPALERRIQYRLAFKEPGPTVSQSIWSNLFARAPIPGTETLDIKSIAEEFPLTGGRIRNAFLAALESAGEEGRITQQILHEACREEYQSGLPKHEGNSRRIAGFSGTSCV